MNSTRFEQLTSYNFTAILKARRHDTIIIQIDQK